MRYPHLVACVRVILAEVSPYIDPRKPFPPMVPAADIPELHIRAPR